MSAWKESLLSSGFTGDIVIPSDPEYKAGLIRFAGNTQQNAGLIAFVKSTEDVSLVIKYATANNIPIVIRGGGHSSGSSTNGGIVIDLSRHLTNVRIDEGKKLAYVAGGATWAAVDSAAIQHGLATVSGTVNHVGVGGFTLGGGYGWLTGEHGLAVDNLVQATIVTADGSILTANEATNNDLFWGIRGGGPNFGCATEFIFRLHPQRRQVFAGALIFPPPRLAEVTAALQEWYATAGAGEAVMVNTVSKSALGGPAVIVLVFFNGDEEEGKQRLKKLFDLGPVANTARMMPFEELNTLHNEALTYGTNYHITGIVRPTSAVDLVGKSFDKILEIANAPGIDLTMVAIWEYYSMEKMSRVPPDATAFAMRVPRGLTVLLVRWTGDTEELDAEARKRLEAIKTFCNEGLEAEFAKIGGRTVHDTGYGNGEMIGILDKDAARRVFGNNYPRLQQLKQKYDPNLVFNSWYPIQPST